MSIKTDITIKECYYGKQARNINVDLCLTLHGQQHMPKLLDNNCTVAGLLSNMCLYNNDFSTANTRGTKRDGYSVRYYSLWLLVLLRKP